MLVSVAYSKHIMHLNSYHGRDDLQNHLEIEAHVGCFFDLAFSYPYKQLCVVACGVDRVIKVGIAVSGTKQYIFQGHEALVYYVCLHRKKYIKFIFSTATDENIKAQWLYDDIGLRVEDDVGFIEENDYVSEHGYLDFFLHDDCYHMGLAAHDAKNENFDQITDYVLEFNDFLLSLGSNVISPNG